MKNKKNAYIVGVIGAIVVVAVVLVALTSQGSLFKGSAGGSRTISSISPGLNVYKNSNPIHPTKYFFSEYTKSSFLAYLFPIILENKSTKTMFFKNSANNSYVVGDHLIQLQLTGSTGLDLGQCELQEQHYDATANSDLTTPWDRIISDTDKPAFTAAAPSSLIDSNFTNSGNFEYKILPGTKIALYLLCNVQSYKTGDNLSVQLVKMIYNNGVETYRTQTSTLASSTFVFP